MNSCSFNGLSWPDPKFQHSDKTFIGRASRGFDFFGYHFSLDGLTVAKDTLWRFVERAVRLYEQEPREPFSSSRLGLYVRRWVGWVLGGNLRFVVVPWNNVRKVEYLQRLPRPGFT
jgi:hypothetical protein